MLDMAAALASVTHFMGKGFITALDKTFNIYGLALTIDGRQAANAFWPPSTW